MTKRRYRVTFTGPLSSRNDEKGLTLIEVLVALGILSAVAVVILLGMSTSSKAVMVSQTRVTVEGLAKSQMEYIKSQAYDAVSNPLVYAMDPNLNVPQGYAVSFTAERMNPKGDDPTNDDGLQKITVTVNHIGEPALTIVGYKLK
jgi:prepilin-type N-terminal cleavage/methylation domain-containing protein